MYCNCTSTTHNGTIIIIMNSVVHYCFWYIFGIIDNVGACTVAVGCKSGLGSTGKVWKVPSFGRYKI